MPNIRGNAWGNALGGYKYQRRGKGGKFAKGKVQGFQTAINKGRTNKAGNTNWKAAAIGAGAALATTAVVAGGIYAVKSGHAAKLLKAPTTAIKNADASIRASAALALKGMGVNVGKSAMSASRLSAARRSLEATSKMAVASGNTVSAMLNADGPSVFEQINNAAKATAAVSGAVVSASAATAVVRATADGIRDEARANRDAPRKPRTPRAGRVSVVPQPGTTNPNKVASGRSVADQVSKGAPPAAKTPHNVEPTALADVFGQPVIGNIRIDPRGKRRSVIADKRPADYTQTRMTPEELAVYKATRKNSLAVKTAPVNKPNKSSATTTANGPSVVDSPKPSKAAMTQARRAATAAKKITEAKKAQQGDRVNTRGYTDAQGIYHPSGFGSAE